MAADGMRHCGPYCQVSAVLLMLIWTPRQPTRKPYSNSGRHVLISAGPQQTIFEGRCTAVTSTNGVLDRWRHTNVLSDLTEWHLAALHVPCLCTRFSLAKNDATTCAAHIVPFKSRCGGRRHTRDVQDSARSCQGMKGKHGLGMVA